MGLNSFNGEILEDSFLTSDPRAKLILKKDGEGLGFFCYKFVLFESKVMFVIILR